MSTPEVAVDPSRFAAYLRERGSALLHAYVVDVRALLVPAAPPPPPRAKAKAD
jgi:hypothetical protein